MSIDMGTIEAMERAVGAGDLAEAGKYLTEDVRYVVGSRPAVVGIPAIFEAVRRQSEIARWTGHTLISVWPTPDALIVEVISHFTRVADGREISFPCLDVYRTRGGRIADWRVFADMSLFHGDPAR